MDNNQVTIETFLNAPPERVWKAWTDPDSVLKWTGSDPNGTGVKAKIDLRPGGSFEITFRNSDQTEFTSMGTYKEIREYRKLVFSWVWKNEPGVESLVTIVLIPEGSCTLMQFEHRDFGTASAHDYGPGWQRTFSKLNRFLEAAAPA
jgi:uncharacterized protein YndB with AHSA1/START domain